MKKISICIPVLNEEENILNAYNKVIKVLLYKQGLDLYFCYTLKLEKQSAI